MEGRSWIDQGTAVSMCLLCPILYVECIFITDTNGGEIRSCDLTYSYHQHCDLLRIPKVNIWDLMHPFLSLPSPLHYTPVCGCCNFALSADFKNLQDCSCAKLAVLYKMQCTVALAVDDSPQAPAALRCIIL